MNFPLTTTLNCIWACYPCDEGKHRALKAAGKNVPDDEPITYQQIVEAVGLEDALWCCRAEPQYHKEWRLFAVWCSRQIQHLMTDRCSIDALDVAERHAQGEATDAELAAACTCSAAITLAITTTAPTTAAVAAIASATATSATAAKAASWSAAAASWSAAKAAAGVAAGETWATPWGVSGDAFREAARDAQREAFVQLVTHGSLPK